MNHWIKDIMDTDFPAIDCDDSIEEVEAKLTDCACNALPVLNPDFSLFGTISQKDLIAFHQAQGNALATRAWEICAPRPATLPQDLNVEDAIELYAATPFRELMVVDHQSRLVGMLTGERLLEHHLRQSTVIQLSDRTERALVDDPAHPALYAENAK